MITSLTSLCFSARRLFVRGHARFQKLVQRGVCEDVNVVRSIAPLETPTVGYANRPHILGHLGALPTPMTVADERHRGYLRERLGERGRR